MLAKTDYKYFAKARQVASISDYKKVHVGCVPVYQGQIVAIACNRDKTHPTQQYYNRYRIKSDTMLPKLHAEINCLNQLKHLDINFSKVKLYIYRLKNDGSYGMTRPCPSCMNAIKDLGIKNIYYTTDFGYVHEKIENKSIRSVA